VSDDYNDGSFCCAALTDTVRRVSVLEEDVRESRTNVRQDIQRLNDKLDRKFDKLQWWLIGTAASVAASLLYMVLKHPV